MDAINGIKRGVRAVYKNKRRGKRRAQHATRLEIAGQAAVNVSPTQDTWMSSPEAPATTPPIPPAILATVPEEGQEHRNSKDHGTQHTTVMASNDAFPLFSSSTALEEQMDVEEPVANVPSESFDEAFPPLPGTNAEEPMEMEDQGPNMPEDTMSDYGQQSEIEDQGPTMPIDNMSDSSLAVHSEPKDPSQCLDSLELQEIREAKYTTFYFEEEGDYTGGPPRIVCANDGVKSDCAALLMTLELSQRIQQTIQYQIAHENLRKINTQKSMIYLRYQAELDSQRRQRKIRRSQLEKQDRDENVVKELAKIDEETSLLTEMLNDSIYDSDMLDSSLRDLQNGWLMVQREVNEYFHDALLAATIMEPEDNAPDTPLEYKDLAVEFEAARKARADEQGLPGGKSLSSEQFEVMEPAIARKPEHKETPMTKYYQTRQRLEEIQDAFNHKELDRENVRHRLGPMDAEAAEAFDLEWLLKFQELTRKLIDAEAAHAAAKDATRDNNISAPSDANSGFANQAGDGYQFSAEHDLVIEAKQQPRVDRWLQGMLEELVSPSGLPSPRGGAFPGDMVLDGTAEQGEEWEVRSVGLSDSISVVARDPWVRGKIDMWEGMTAALKSEAED